MSSRPGLFALALVAGAVLTSCKADSRRSEGSAAEQSPGAEGAPRTSQKLVASYDALADDILETRKREVEIVRSILDATHDDAARAMEDARKAIASGNQTVAKDAIEDLAMLVGYLGTEGDGSIARVRKRLVEGGHHFNPLLNQPGAPGGTHAGDAHHSGDKAHHAGDKGHHAGAPTKDGGHAAGEKPAGHAPGQPPPAGHAAGQPPPAGHAQDKAHHAGAPAHHEAGQHGEGHHGDAAGSRGYDPGFVVVTRGAKRTFLDASRAMGKLAAAPSADGLEKEWAKVEAAWAEVRG